MPETVDETKYTLLLPICPAALPHSSRIDLSFHGLCPDDEALTTLPLYFGTIIKLF
jgi:hypothetical protein